MKIEKLTENKIRIIIKQEDFKDYKINIHELFLTDPAPQKLFLEILDKARKEVNFNTDGHKLLIETYLQNEDVFVFTITKYAENKSDSKKSNKKYLTLKNTKQPFNTSCLIYQFNKFEDFCDFCNYIYKKNNINLRGLFKTSLLYIYNDTYYLVINDINFLHKSLNTFLASLLEFSIPLKHIKNFKFKLKEHGKIFIKNNAISTGIKYFANHNHP